MQASQTNTFFPANQRFNLNACPESSRYRPVMMFKLSQEIVEMLTSCPEEIKVVLDGKEDNQLIVGSKSYKFSAVTNSARESPMDCYTRLPNTDEFRLVGPVTHKLAVKRYSSSSVKGGATATSNSEKKNNDNSIWQSVSIAPPQPQTQPTPRNVSPTSKSPPKPNLPTDSSIPSQSSQSTNVTNGATTTVKSKTKKATTTKKPTASTTATANPTTSSSTSAIPTTTTSSTNSAKLPTKRKKATTSTEPKPKRRKTTDPKPSSHKKSSSTSSSKLVYAPVANHSVPSQSKSKAQSQSMDPNSEFFSVEYRRLSRQFKTRYEEYSRLHDILTNSKERVEEFTKLAKKLEECESRSKSKQNGMINGHGNGNGNGKVHGDVNGTSKDKEEEAKIRREFKKLYEKWNGKEVERTVERFKKLHEEVAGLKEKILGMHKLVEQSR